VPFFLHILKGVDKLALRHKDFGDAFQLTPCRHNLGKFNSSSHWQFVEHTFRSVIGGSRMVSAMLNFNIFPLPRI
jgi:hypothetical protein